MCRCVSAVEFQDHKRRTSSGNSNAQVVTSGANVLWSCYLSWKSAAQRAEPPRKRCWNEQCVVAFQTSQPISSQLRSVKTCGNLNNIKLNLNFWLKIWLKRILQSYNIWLLQPSSLSPSFSEAIRTEKALLWCPIGWPGGKPRSVRSSQGATWRELIYTIYLCTQYIYIYIYN